MSEKPSENDSEKIERKVKEGLIRYDFSLLDKKIMEIIERKDKPTKSDVRKEIGDISERAFSEHIDKLEREGYVKAVRSPYDKRKHILELSNKPYQDEGVHNNMANLSGNLPIKIRQMDSLSDLREVALEIGLNWIYTLTKIEEIIDGKSLRERATEEGGDMDLLIEEEERIANRGEELVNKAFEGFICMHVPGEGHVFGGDYEEIKPIIEDNYPELRHQFMESRPEKLPEIGGIVRKGRRYVKDESEEKEDQED